MAGLGVAAMIVIEKMPLDIAEGRFFFVPHLDRDKNHHPWDDDTTVVLISAPRLWLLCLRFRHQKLFLCQKIVCIWCRQLLRSFDTSLIICSEFEMLLTPNFHLEGFCQATGHDASPCSASPGGSVCVCYSAFVHMPGGGMWVCTLCVRVNVCARQTLTQCQWLLLVGKVSEPLMDSV